MTGLLSSLPLWDVDGLPNVTLAISHVLQTVQKYTMQQWGMHHRNTTCYSNAACRQQPQQTHCHDHHTLMHSNIDNLKYYNLHGVQARPAAMATNALWHWSLPHCFRTAVLL